MALKNYTSITWSEYNQLFTRILENEITTEPYTDSAYINYVKLNKSRMERWLKKVEIPDAIQAKIKQIDKAQTWILLTEPWCGDAAHNTPFIALLAALNPLIELKIVLRDSNLELMDKYLTNRGRAIPKLLIEDLTNGTIKTWGPRPKKAQDLMLDLKAKGLDKEAIHHELQKWYNEDKGMGVMEEIVELFV